MQMLKRDKQHEKTNKWKSRPPHLPGATLSKRTPLTVKINSWFRTKKFRSRCSYQTESQAENDRKKSTEERWSLRTTTRKRLWKKIHFCLRILPSRTTTNWWFNRTHQEPSLTFKSDPMSLRCLLRRWKCLPQSSRRVLLGSSSLVQDKQKSNLTSVHPESLLRCDRDHNLNLQVTDEQCLTLSSSRSTPLTRTQGSRPLESPLFCLSTSKLTLFLQRDRWLLKSKLKCLPGLSKGVNHRKSRVHLQIYGLQIWPKRLRAQAMDRTPVTANSDFRVHFSRVGASHNLRLHTSQALPSFHNNLWKLETPKLRLLRERE